MRRLLLWDIDHTLIENSGVSKAIYAGAYCRLTSRAPTVPPATEGKTDRLIMREMFESNEMPTPEWPDIQAALQAAALDHQDELREIGFVLPGVHEVLERLAGRGDVAQTIVTGNILENAIVKLSAFALDGLFDFRAGAYGSDSEDRHELVRLAKARSTRLYGVRFDARNTTVVGDTPRDIEAAHRGGARIVAVATGPDSETQLRLSGADIVLPNLIDIERAINLMLDIENP
ncbi:HAD hydrolase-like protein [Kribbella qitaiheensis]|uniref:HAD hydrolase-like protein n=1 Tax=Kribbella qitaiheensis TaxID=1544730 RepID=UPI00361D1CDE